MNRNIKVNIRHFINEIIAEGSSMRRRFFTYILSAITLVLSLIILVLNLSGIMNPTNAQIVNVLDTQLHSFADNIERDYDKAAAHAISFAAQLETQLGSYLTDHGLTFAELKNNAEALSDLQRHLYGTVYLHMQLTPSSGAFYILDTTVNSHSDTPLYNGIYLKYINLYSENTLNNEIALYRGSFSAAKEGGLTFHSGWNNEMRTDFFETCTEDFSDGTHYVLSRTVEIPETWERARYVYVPIHDPEDRIIGVCGFEINDLFFQLSKKASEDKMGQLVGALLDEDSGTYSGQFNSNRYNTINSGSVRITEKHGNTLFDFGSERCIGRTQSVRLGGDTFTAAIMISEAQFDALVHRGQLKTAAIFFVIVLIMLAYCLFMSRKYVSPILKKIDQLRCSDGGGEQLKIHDIEDLFAFYEERITIHEEQLKALVAAKQAAEEEQQRTKAAYQKALEEYELAQNELLHLSKEGQKEIVLEDYEYFVCNLKTLTPQEQRIYDLYLDGKTTAEISEIIGIKENTMKYHNKNIYSKLGVSSRKQFLRFAALKQYQDKKHGSNG